MKYRKFGNTNLMVSEIGFGAWAIGGGATIGETLIGWGDANDHESRQAIFAAVDAGINFFDTADIYGLGHSENILGETIGSNKEMIIATKVGNVARDNAFATDYTKEYIIGACEQSLKRLRRDVIDYYQLHTARLQHLQTGECIEAMQQLQQQGKVRYWGLSLNTFEPEPEAHYLIEYDFGSGCQLVLNLINQKALPLLKMAGDIGYGIIARMPLQFGLLTGKFDNEINFADNDHRKNRLTQQVIETSNNVLQHVWQLCEKYSCSKTELAISYVLSHPQVSTVIPGIRSAKQVAANTTNLFQLSTEELLMIEQLGKTDLNNVMQLIQQQG